MEEENTNITTPFDRILLDLFVWKFSAQMKLEKTKNNILFEIHGKLEKRGIKHWCCSSDAPLFEGVCVYVCEGEGSGVMIEGVGCMVHGGRDAINWSSGFIFP